MSWPKIFFWFLCAILLLPVAYLLFGIAAPVSPENWEHIRAYLLAPAIRDSLIVTTAVCIISLVLGIPAAWCVTRYQFPGRRLFSILLVLPLAVPSYVAAYISTDAREALIPWLVEIRRSHGIDTYLMVEMVNRYTWLCVMLAAVLYPYVFLAARAAFAGSASSLSDASRSLGKGPLVTFFKVNLPLARPALVAGLFLVAMETLNDYGAVQHFGVQTLTPTLFRTWFGMQDLESARRLAAWILLTILAARFLEHHFRGRASYVQRLGPSRPREHPSIRTRCACYFACLVPISIGFIYPSLTLLNWLRLTGGPEQTDDFLRATIHAVLLALTVTIACIAIALPLLGINRFLPNSFRTGIVRALGIAGYAAPGAVLSIAIFSVASMIREQPLMPDFLAPVLISGSILWLTYGLVVRYFAIAGQTLQEGFTGISGKLDSSARLLGSSPLGTFFKVQLPLLRPTLAAAAVIIFIDVIKELPLTLILRPFDFETLGTWTYGLATQGKILACAAPSLAIIAIGSIGLIVVELFIWKRL